MSGPVLVVPSVKWVRTLIDDVTGSHLEADDGMYERTFDQLGLDVVGRIEVGARIAAACGTPTPIDVIADGAATPSALICELITSQLDLTTPTHQGG